MGGSAAGTAFEQWIIEGEGKGLGAKYPRRKPALAAENVLAFSFRVGLRQ